VAALAVAAAVVVRQDGLLAAVSAMGTSLTAGCLIAVATAIA